MQFHFGYRLLGCIPKRSHLFYISINNVWSDLFSNLYFVLSFVIALLLIGRKRSAIDVFEISLIMSKVKDYILCIKAYLFL